MLPPKYYYVHYDAKTGEILAFFNPMIGKPTETPTILISVEQHGEISGAPNKYRVLEGRITQVSNEAVAQKVQNVDIPKALIAGFVYKGVCYALEPSALSVLQLDLAIGGDHARAVIHTAEGSRLESLERDLAVEVATAIIDHIGGLYSSLRH